MSATSPLRKRRKTNLTLRYAELYKKAEPAQSLEEQKQAKERKKLNRARTIQTI